MKSVHAIYGPPGTGKTRRLSDIIKSIVKTTNDVAVLSFSKAAAGVLVSRINPKQVKYIGTIHSLAFKALGLTKKEVADSSKFAKFYGIDDQEVDVALSVHRHSMMTDQSLSESYNCLSSGALIVPYYLVENIAQSYQIWKKNNFLVDFDDMLINAIGKADKFEVVIIDEAQDLSMAQWRFIESLIKKDGEIIMAGDDDQAIFSWAGARPELMAQVQDTHEILSKSWRIPATVHNIAQKTIKQISNRVEKVYSPRDFEGEINFIPDYHTTLVKGPHTVLARSQWVLRKIEADLIEMAIPYIGGMDYFNKPKARVARAIMLEDFVTLRRLKKHLITESRELVEGNKELTGDWRSHVNLSTIPDTEYQYIDSVDLLADPEITMSTIHSFKGGEDDHVVVVGEVSSIVESVTDSVVGFDDEIRVWYVALTRAKSTLTIAGENDFILI